MKKILLTNFNIINYSGSEIDTITVADYFVNSGYEVDIFTLKKGTPLIDKVNKNVRIVTIEEKDLLGDMYEIIWGHHYPLLDYILFTLKIKSNFVFYISLSSFEPYEALPEYYNDLSLIGAISEEVKNKLICEGCDSEKIVLFPNYATKEHFDVNIKKLKEIKKICIVSNHVPDELKEFRNICEKEDIKVDIYGNGFISKYVNSEVLNEYDVVISIGKTVYYAMAMGKPVYCYDYFGGYGYINKDNVEEAYKCNFSGRGFGKKKASVEILSEIKDGFSMAQKDLMQLKEFSYDNFNFENNMDKLLIKIRKNKIDNDKLITKYPSLLRKSRLYMENMENLNYLEREVELYRMSVDTYKNQYEAIINSSSWKITKPIRKIKEILYKLKNKLGVSK